MKYELFEYKLVLVEGIEELKKYFPKIPSEKIDELLALDPTYNPEKNTVGMYGRWIVQMYWNSITNADRMEKYKKFIAMYPNGIHPITGQEIKEPDMKPEIKDEDLYKVPILLSNYTKYKSKLNKPITSYKSLGELTSEISPLMSSGITASKVAQESLNVIKEAIVDGFNVIFNNTKWLIGIPETYASSSHFKEPVSHWCTAYPERYKEYMRDYGGKYYILLNKNTGELFQFHFESNQFMNKHDNRIDLERFFNTYNDVKRFFISYGNNIGIPAIQFNKFLNVESKYNNSMLSSLSREINKNSKYDANFSRDIVNNKKFWRDLFKNYVQNYSNSIHKFKKFINEYIYNNHEFQEENFDFSIINNLQQNERNNLIKEYPLAFSSIKSYDNSNIEQIYQLIYIDRYLDINKILSTENIKKFNEDNLKELKSIIVKTARQNPDDTKIITFGVLESLNSEFLTDIIQFWNEPLKLFNSIYLKLRYMNDGSKIFKKTIDILNTSLEKFSDRNLTSDNEYELSIDKDSLKKLIKHLSDKAYNELISLFGISNRLDYSVLQILLQKANKNIQRMLLKSKNLDSLYFIDNIDPSIQKEMIDKNKFNIKYIKNLDKNVKKYALQKYPELKDFIRGI